MPKVSARAKTGQGSKLEAKVAADLKALGLMDGCERQYRFHPERKWLVDFAWDDYWIEREDGFLLKRVNVALEVNGGTYSGGSHSRGPRQRGDYEKWSELSLMGWTLILVDCKDVREGVHVERVLRALGRA